MQDASLVRVMDGLGDGLEIRGGALGRQRTVLCNRGQTAARDVFHGEEMLAVVEADFVNGDNVRMLQTGGRGGLAAKAVHRLGTRLRAEQDRFDRNNSVEANLSRRIAISSSNS